MERYRVGGASTARRTPRARRRPEHTQLTRSTPLQSNQFEERRMAAVAKPKAKAATKPKAPKVKKAKVSKKATKPKAAKKPKAKKAKKSPKKAAAPKAK
ncbi:unnamed protein product, partial [Mesorhabditis belari]|uniref:Histone H1 n=1 Tax=Mesorhabditis belari TaxID=2138241 RepID=A0AAF3FMQ3_9BILA